LLCCVCCVYFISSDSHYISTLSMVKVARKKMRFPEDMPYSKRMFTEGATASDDDDQEEEEHVCHHRLLDLTHTPATPDNDTLYDPSRHPLGRISAYLTSDHLVWSVTSFLDVSSLSHHPFVTPTPLDGRPSVNDCGGPKSTCVPPQSHPTMPAGPTDGRWKMRSVRTLPTMN
jgi:hypothetical protein